MSDLDSLIRFWQDALSTHRLLMEPSAIYLVEQTIKRLEGLKSKLKEVTNLSENYGLPRCPYCRSIDIKPVGAKLFHCNDCSKDFSEAVVEEEPPIPEPKKPKRK